MPDFERVIRKLEIDLAPADRRPLIVARHEGEDRARLQILYVVVSVALIVDAVGILMALANQ